jgi:hypothetical protein
VVDAEPVLVCLQGVPEPKPSPKNRLHLDIQVPDAAAAVSHAERLGALPTGSSALDTAGNDLGIAHLVAVPARAPPGTPYRAPPALAVEIEGLVGMRNLGRTEYRRCGSGRGGGSATPSCQPRAVAGPMALPQAAQWA